MKKKILLLLTAVALAVVTTACNGVEQDWDNLVSRFQGRSVTIQTYDEESQLIDQVKGSHVDITSDTTFNTSSEGNNSGVMQISVGKNMMHHVGSSLIMYQDGLYDIMTDKNARVNIENYDKGTPLINYFVHDFKNYFGKGSAKVIMIRSQNGTPLAVFAGNSVSLFKTDVPKSTGFRIDGKYLFVYRCDYTVYDTALLDGSVK